MQVEHVGDEDLKHSVDDPLAVLSKNPIRFGSVYFGLGQKGAG